jgi:hypothetical protein
MAMFIDIFAALLALAAAAVWFVTPRDELPPDPDPKAKSCGTRYG